MQRNKKGQFVSSKEQKNLSQKFSKKFNYFANTPIRVKVEKNYWVASYTAHPNLEEIRRVGIIRNWITLVVYSILVGTLIGIIISNI